MQAYYVHLNMQVYYVDHVNVLCPPCKCIMLIYVDHVRIRKMDPVFCKYETVTCGVLDYSYAKP